MRKRAYPKWVNDGRMTREQSQHEIECMEAICGTVEKVLLLQEVSEEMLAGK
jgi:hypothetical protein